MLTATAWAQTLQEQINSAEAGTTITLTENVTLTERIDVNKNLTVDLGGYTITTTATCGNGSAFNIVSGIVTIQNGTIDASFGEANSGETDAITARSGSDVTLKNLNITVKSKNGACAYAFEGSKITIESGVYENQTTEIYEWNANIKAMVVNQANVATQLVFIKGGTFKGYDPTLGDDSQTTNENATFLAEGVALQKDASGNYTTTTAVAKIGGKNYASLADAISAVTAGQTVTLLVDQTLSSELTIAADKNFTLDLDGKVLTLEAKLYNNGTLVVKSTADGGKITRSSTVIYNYSADASFTLQSGTLEATGNTPNGVINNKGTLTINGGEINAQTVAIKMEKNSLMTTIAGGSIHTIGKNAITMSDGKCNITGGTVSSTELNVILNSTSALKSSVSVTSNAVATLSDGYSYALIGALACANADETITLTNDSELTTEATVTKNVTINLNGHNISSTQTALKITSGTLTISGNGTVKGASANAKGVTNIFYPAVYANGGNIVINGGTYDDGGVDGYGFPTIYADGSSSVTINNGTFKNCATSDGKYWVLNTKDGSSASIVVYGGEFYNFDPANNVNDGNPENQGTNYVADGYITECTATSPDYIYTVVEGKWIAKINDPAVKKFRFPSLDAAIDAANTVANDITITLLADATATVEPSSNVTIDAASHVVTLPTFNVADGSDVSYAKVTNATDDTYKVTTATYNRTGAAGTQWGTACLPFSFETAPTGYTLYTPSAVSETTLTVTAVSYPVAIGTPVIFFKESTAEATITSANASVKINAEPVAQSGDIKLVGTFAKTTITSGLANIYYINGDAFHQAKASLTVPAYRAYINYTTAPLGAKPSVLNLFVDGNEATYVGAVIEDNATVESICDILGRQFSAPKKGINIMKLNNGKTVKLIIK